MNMKWLMVLTGIIMAIILVSAIIYRLVNIIPPDNVSKDTQAIAILDDASCLSCHTKNNNRPLHADVPALGNILKSVAGKGSRNFDISGSIDKINRGEAINETVLAKIEMATVIRQNMPPPGFYFIHWGSSVTPAKRELLEEWIKSYRERFYPNPLAAGRFKNEPVRPLSSSTSVNENKAALGEKLFHDTRLSHNNMISCASCHRLNSGGADNKQYPEGVNKILGKINTPTVFNACFSCSQFRDGRAPDLKTHTAEHLLDPLTMAAESFDIIIKRLLHDNDMNQVFNRLYEDGITETSIIDAIESFEKMLITPNCRFDKYLKGENDTFNESEIRGYKVFKSNKCATCHAGVILGGQSYERMGIHKDYFEERGWEITHDDLGRFNQTGDEYDRFRFKVPGLRNVALTKPYFHDGSRQTLYDAVKIMGTCQSGHAIKDDDIKAIVSFLESLTGEYKK
ncbi:MAG: heme-binding domain-containing protein [Tannerella sp.]|jgi:cytochrome c peroxidase|nr:heme-binding domain-containing protein [Tannerella sp.]